MTFKPMLSGKAPADLSKLSYPVIASPKLDGIRAIRLGDRLVSRTLKDIPNDYVRNWCIKHLPDGLDGELLLRDWTAPFNEVSSAIMSRDGEPDFVFAVFDYLSDGWHNGHGRNLPAHEVYFQDRLVAIPERPSEHFDIVPHTYIDTVEKLQALDDYHHSQGYEGTMVRAPNGPYKFGRSTTKEGYLLKIKRFEDEEATVIGVVEEMHNTNEATVDHLGHTKRSTAKAGKVGKNRLGAFVCRFDDGTEFECGSGFTEQERIDLWAECKEAVRSGFNVGELFQDRPITVKHLPPPGGRKPGEAPRHPVFKGFRRD